MLLWHGPDWLVQQNPVWEVLNQDIANCETKKSEVIYEANLFTRALFSFGGKVSKEESVVVYLCLRAINVQSSY